MKMYAIKNYQRFDNTYPLGLDREGELDDVSVTALFTTREAAHQFVKLTPDVEMEIQEVQVSGSIDLGGMEIVRD